MGRVLPGNSERGVTLATQLGGSKWRLILATQCGDSLRQTKVGGLLGGSIWRLRRAAQFGESFQRVY
jgi:hypothetical protein